MGYRGKVALEPQTVAPARPKRTANLPQAPQGPQGGPAQGDYAARERMVSEHLPLVHSLSRRFVRSGELLEDLFQVGSIGLLKAIKKFDPSMGFKFKTYAVPVIVGEIKNYLRDHGWAVKVPRKVQTHKLAVLRAVESLSQSLGRSTTPQEIAGATGLTQEEVYDTFEVGNYGRPLSLGARYESNGTSDTSSLLDYLGIEDPQFDWLSNRMDLANTMNCLDKREKTILYLKFFAGLSQTDIAGRLGISQMHVSRLQRQALGKLRQGLIK